MSPVAAETLPVVPNCEAGEHVHPRPRVFLFWTWAHRLSALTFLVVFALEPWIPDVLFHGNFNGAVWLGTWTILDPLAGLEIALASRMVTWEWLTGIATTVIAAALLGRVFCGWVCPLGVVLELNQALAERVASTHRLRPAHRELPRSWKYYILAGCLVASFTAGIPWFATYSPINLPFVMRGVWWTLAPVAALVVIEWWFPRVFCRSLCPLGALYSLMGRTAFWRVRVTGEERLACRRCSRDCPMGIDVMEAYVCRGSASVDDPECTRCGICTDQCLGHILKLGWAPPPLLRTRRR